MNSTYPVFTIKSECMDCYKCVRGCPVKAIKISDSHASVIAEKCIACGECISICPQNAKKVRNDIGPVEALISSESKVCVSIAPSWKASFSCSFSQLAAGLRRIGFDIIEETALGAQEVSAHAKAILRSRKQSLWISSACPVIVDYICKYMPDFAKNILPLLSPAAVHGKMLKKKHGKDTAVVFIGPCAGKKNEADQFPDLIDAALGFGELSEMLSRRGILPEKENAHPSGAELNEVYEGALYPVEGGMNQTLRLSGNINDVQLISISTVGMLQKQLKNLNQKKLTGTVFIEALACSGGCMNGPLQCGKEAGVNSVCNTLNAVRYRDQINGKLDSDISRVYRPEIVIKATPSPEQIRKTMTQIGKSSVEDELNCGGCGYGSCRELAVALINKTAEPSMCISYMRKIAARKAGAVFNCMPSGILMVNRELRILETNRSFIRMFAPEFIDVYENDSDCLNGALLHKVLPCAELFESVLETDIDMHKEHYPLNSSLYEISIFTIEPHQIAGAVIADVTKYEMRREQIAKNAQAVIAKNMEIVQNIACSLGEHMVETEMLLSSIAEGFEPEKNPDNEKNRSRPMDFLNGLGALYE